MSFTSGIGNIQQAINLTAPSPAKTSTQSGMSGDIKDDGGSIANVVHTDRTNLSFSSGLVTDALKSSDVRSAKVASLQQAIAAGSYRVSSSDVAEKIFESLLF